MSRIFDYLVFARCFSLGCAPDQIHKKSSVLNKSRKIWVILLLKLRIVNNKQFLTIKRGHS